MRSGGQVMRWPHLVGHERVLVGAGAEALEDVRHGERLLQEDQALRICVN